MKALLVAASLVAFGAPAYADNIDPDIAAWFTKSLQEAQVADQLLCPGRMADAGVCKTLKDKQFGCRILGVRTFGMTKRYNSARYLGLSEEDATAKAFDRETPDIAKFGIVMGIKSGAQPEVIADKTVQGCEQFYLKGKKP